MTYRYLDIRRNPVKDKLILRAKMSQVICIIKFALLNVPLLYYLVLTTKPTIYVTTLL
jgi:aspartyl-tRNA synthetase